MPSRATQPHICVYPFSPNSPPIQAARQQCVLSASELTPIRSQQVTVGHFLSRCGRVNSSLTVLSQDKAGTNTDCGRLTRTFWAESLKMVQGSGVKDLGDNNCQCVRLLSSSGCSDLNPCPFTWGTQLTPWNPLHHLPRRALCLLPVTDFLCFPENLHERETFWNLVFLKKLYILSFYLIDNLNESKSKTFLICNPLYVTFFFSFLKVSWLFSLICLGMGLFSSNQPL